MLAALAKWRHVAVSRGELVEIGGSFPIPEIMAASGADLIEIGTTNRTQPADYKAAIAAGAELLLKVHTSNYEIVGFKESTGTPELSSIAHHENIPLLYDMDSCFLFDPEVPYLKKCRTAPAGLSEGADVICFSGDKLFGASQAVILAGRRDPIEIIRSHPLARVLRPDNLTLQVLEAVLDVCRSPLDVKKRIPVLRRLSLSPETLRAHAESLADRLTAVQPGWSFSVRNTDDEAGGGSLPNICLPGYAVAVIPPDRSIDALEEKLRLSDQPVISRIHDGTLLLSVRTLLDGDEDRIIEVFSGLPNR